MRWCQAKAMDVTYAECAKCKIPCEQDKATAEERDKENREEALRDWECDE